jgi:excisionase family DNA binding protein
MAESNYHRNVTVLADRRGWSVLEASDILGVSRNFLMGQIRQGLLRARRFGRRVIILREDLETYLASAAVVGTKNQDGD